MCELLKAHIGINQHLSKEFQLPIRRSVPADEAEVVRLTKRPPARRSSRGLDAAPDRDGKPEGHSRGAALKPTVVRGSRRFIHITSPVPLGRGPAFVVYRAAGGA